MINITIDDDTLMVTDEVTELHYNDTKYRFFQAFGRYPDPEDERMGLERVIQIQGVINQLVAARQREFH
jgi:hypothetical protein